MDRISELAPSDVFSVITANPFSGFVEVYQHKVEKRAHTLDYNELGFNYHSVDPAFGDPVISASCPVF